MEISRRRFLGTTAMGAAALGAGAVGPAPGAAVVGSPAASPPAPNASDYDPWLEVDREALLQNARLVGELAGGRPVMAVVKNNGYGLGVRTVSTVLDQAPEIRALAVVTAQEAVELRDAGVTKPVLLMGFPGPEAEEELVARDVRLAPFLDDSSGRLEALARRRGSPVPVHLYVDTGMSRLGIPYHRAVPWMRELLGTGAVRVEGTFMAFTETDDFDPEQLARFRAMARDAAAEGLELGPLHAASSHGLFHRPEAHLDMVRPGLALFGAYPSGAREKDLAELRPAHRLRARVVRVTRLRAGDSVSYGRNYVAEGPVWIATLPVGHADGYPRRSVDGCKVLIGERTYPVIGAVSASHTIVEVGPAENPPVRVGDVATLVGPDHPAIHPNEVASRAGISVYDVLMHLGARLPVRVSG